MKRTVRFITANICGVLTSLIFILSFSFITNAAEEESKPLTFNSLVEVESYEVEGGYIEAGKETKIILKIHNSNRYTAANNLVVTASSSSGMIFPAYGNDNQFFVGTLTADATATVEMPVVAASDLHGDYVDFTCTFMYESGGNRITNMSSMVLPTQNLTTIVVNSLDVSAHATLNGKSLLSIAYSNNSASNIDDAVLKIEGNISEATQAISLGTIAAGKNYIKDCNIIFTEGGEQSITIKLEYTGLNNEPVSTELGTFKVNVDKESVSTISGKNENTTLVWIGRAIALCALCIVVAAVLLYIKKR